MNGLTRSELRMLVTLRKACRSGDRQDIETAKGLASRWIRADRKRAVKRQQAARTIKGLFS